RDDLAAKENRRDHHHVGHVRVAGLVGIVGDETVAVAHLGARVARAHALNRLGVEQRVILQAAAHHDDAPVRIAQAGGAVLGFAQDRRIPAVEQRVRHGGRGLADAADHHGGRDRVEAHDFCSVMMRLPTESTARRCPASTTVVESYCSTIAGPSSETSAASRARSYTSASAKAPRARSYSARLPVRASALPPATRASARCGTGTSATTRNVTSSASSSGALAP